jgi:7-carboxy-7-deazaguanine synthase
MKVAERFYSIQGEGRMAGAPSYFIRLAGCNLGCPWCDTTKVWKNVKEELTVKELIPRVFEDLQKQCENYGNVRIVFTGGEPTLQAKEITEFCDKMGDFVEDMNIDIETNGTYIDSSFFLQFANIVISPKLKSAGYGLEYYKKMNFLSPLRTILAENYPDFKFVVGNEADVQEVLEWCKELAILPEDITLMPCCITRKEHEDKSRKVVEWCKQYGFRYSPRLQLMLWDKTTGV